MPGDYSRYLFDPDKGYSQVLMQQGRVQLDACWNAMVYLDSYNKAQVNRDILGYAAAPGNDAGFTISIAEAASTTTSGSDQDGCPESNIHRFMISQGRCYLDGLLLQNNADVSFADQPFLPNPSDYFPSSNPSENQQYVVYLDNWQRCITALEDPVIADAALGGTDTSTRTQPVWQVKLQALDDKQQPNQQTDTQDGSSPTFDQYWTPSNVKLPTEQGQLQARVSAGERSDLNNCFYRIEIHKSITNTSTGATINTQYKWSRDNAALRVVVTDMVEITDQDTTNADGYYPAKLTLRLLERDVPFFSPGNPVELTDSRLELQEKAGLLSTIYAVTDNILTVLVSKDQVILWNLLALDNPEYNTDDPQVEYCRHLTRWDGFGPISADWQSLTSPQGGYDPIQIRFNPSQQQLAKTEQTDTAIPPAITAALTMDSFEQGKYWNFCSRRLSGALDWPTQKQGTQVEPVACPAHGPQHRYTGLTRVALTTDGDMSVVEDSQFLPQFNPLSHQVPDQNAQDNEGDDNAVSAQALEQIKSELKTQLQTQLDAMLKTPIQQTQIDETQSNLSDSVQSSLDALIKQISDDADTIKQLQTQQASDKASIDSLNATVTELNTTVTSLAKQITPLATKVSQLESLAKGQIDTLVALKQSLPDSTPPDDNKES
jgi:uncharacterized coiled-coil protein SlyX